MAVTKRRRAAATTMVEVMLAIVIVTIVVVGCSMLFASARGQICRQKNFRAATQLAAQQLENLKAGSYGSITDSNTPESVTFDGVTYTRSTNVVDANSCKTVTVTVGWGGGNDPNVSLVTIIAP